MISVKQAIIVINMQQLEGFYDIDIWNMGYKIANDPICNVKLFISEDNFIPLYQIRCKIDLETTPRPTVILMQY